MESLGQAGLFAAAGVVLLVVLGLALLAVRRARAAELVTAAELARSRAVADSVSQRLDELVGQLAEVRRDTDRARERQPEYVITSLVSADDVSQLLPEVGQRSAAEALEDQLVDALARHRGHSPLRARVVDVVVRTVALGHGVRRALSPDVLDRAAAEAHVARRRSRRDRRREVREARRLLRAVREQTAA